MIYFQLEQFSSSFPTQDQLKEELRKLKFSLSKIQSPIVLCHNDPMPANMVLRGGKIFRVKTLPG